MAVSHGGQTYLFEWKVVDGTPTGEALAQLRAKGYAEKYRHLGASVHLVGVEFDRSTRRLVGFEAEPLLPERSGSGG